MLIWRALYDGKSAGCDYWLQFCACIEFFGFTSYKADADVWMCEALKPDCTKYWEYAILYTDNYLVFIMNPEKILKDEIGKYFTLKPNLIGTFV